MIHLTIIFITPYFLSTKCFTPYLISSYHISSHLVCAHQYLICSVLFCIVLFHLLQGDNYFELDVDVGSSSVARWVACIIAQTHTHTHTHSFSPPLHYVSSSFILHAPPSFAHETLQRLILADCSCFFFSYFLSVFICTLLCCYFLWTFSFRRLQFCSLIVSFL